MPESVDAREQRWTLWVDRAAGNVVRVDGPPASGCEELPVVPAARLAEVERELAERTAERDRAVAGFNRMEAEWTPLHAALDRAREALEEIRDDVWHDHECVAHGCNDIADAKKIARAALDALPAPSDTPAARGDER